MDNETFAGDSSDSAEIFAAFVSYSHADERMAHWLHKRLESYRIPLARPGVGGGAPRRRLGKVFRDRADLSAGHDLSTEIQRRLKQSEALLVLCSPSSCNSAYVNEEIRYFKSLGRGDRIFAAIVGGEPHASEKVGYAASDECFPAALRFDLDADGSISFGHRAAERLAADFRPGKEGRASAALRLIAGILGVDFDDLVQRDKRRSLVRGASLALGAMTIVAAVVVAGIQIDRVRQGQTRTFADRSWQAIETGDFELAARYALAGWHLEPRNEQAYRAALARVMHDTGGGRWIAQGESVSVSADGTVVATSSSDRTVTVWDAATGLATRELGDLSDAIQQIALSPDGLRIVIVSENSTASIRTVASGVELSTFQAPTDTSIVDTWVSPDGQSVVVSLSDYSLAIWSADPQRPPVRMVGHQAHPVSVAFSPDGSRVVTTSRDELVVVWEAASGRALYSIQGHGGYFDHDGIVNSARFSPDGRMLLTAANDSVAKLWDTATGREIRSFVGHGEPIVAGVFSGDGSRIATVSYDNTARVWNTASGAGSLVLRGHTGTVVDVRFSPNGDAVVTASEDRTARIWDSRTGQSIAVLRAGPSAVVNAAFSPDGSRIVVVDADGIVRTWARPFGGIVATIEGWDRPTPGPWQDRLLFSTHDRLVEIDLNSLTPTEFAPASGIAVSTFSRDRRLIVQPTHPRGEGAILWDVAAGGPVRTLTGPRFVTEAAWNSGGSMFATADVDGNVFVFDRSGANISRIERARGDVRELSFSPDSQRLLAVVSGAGAFLWGVNDGHLIHSLNVESAGATDAAFDPMGHRVATVHTDDVVRVWSVSSGALVTELSGHSASVQSISFHPHAQLLLTSSFDGTARIWNLANNRPVGVFRDPQGFTGAAFAEDGTRIVTTGVDGVARVWDVESSRELASFVGDDNELRSGFIGSEGRYLATVSYNGIVRVSDVSSSLDTMEELSQSACASLLPARSQARTFTSEEIDADDLLRRLWGSPTGRDVCSGQSLGH
jgi:WD40 repeat protein